MRIVALISVVVALVGCASAYKPEGFGGGFSESQLDTNVFRVSFRGNGFTRAERAEELALLRSAELTLKNDFSHFVVIDSQSHERCSSYTTPAQSYTTANATAYGNSAYGMAQTTTYGGQLIPRQSRAQRTPSCVSKESQIIRDSYMTRSSFAIH